jgi:integrase
LSLRKPLTENSIWWIVREYAGSLDLAKIAPHDLRTCARLCRESGGALEQIQLLLGHGSIQTTMDYLGTRQNLAKAVMIDLGSWTDTGIQEGVDGPNYGNL